MLPKKHFFIGLGFSIILYFGFDVSLLNCFIFLIASFCIDVDHYLYYAYKERDWNLRKAFDWFLEKGRKMRKMDNKERKKFYSAFCFLHGIESLILFGVLGLVWSGFYFVALGFGFHLILDYVYDGDRFDKISAIWTYFKYKKMKYI